MDKSKQMGLRLPQELIDRLDQYVDKLGEELPGVEFTRSDAIRTLIEQGLQKAGIPSKEKVKRKR
jgi:metal-responsive CopG/Arc/MetJ family transcriptional regulator